MTRASMIIASPRVLQAGYLLGLVLALGSLGSCQSGRAIDPTRLPVDDLVVVADFRINIFAIVPGATSLAAAPDGAIYAGTTRGEIVRLLDRDHDGIADEAVRLEVRLEPPIALARDADGGIYAVGRDRMARLQADGAETIVPPGVLPAPALDGRRHLAVGPDGRLYLSLGAPCEGCPGRRLARSILDMRPDGHELEKHARGVRDPGALDWHPATGRLMFADDAPGPFAAQHRISGLFQLAERSILPSGTAPVSADFEAEEWLEVVPELTWTFPAGLAPWGMDFYDGDLLPKRFSNALLVALNPIDETDEIGSEVMAVRFSRDGRPEGEDVLLAGWRQRDGKAWGRPVDIEEHGDGSVLISDDLAGLIYRLTYQP